MGVETVALMAHTLDKSGLLTLASRLTEGTGQDWSWHDDSPNFAETNFLDLWHHTETLLVQSSEAYLRIGPRSAALDLVQRLHYGDVSPEVYTKCHRLIEDVARVLGSSASLVIPDSCFEISQANDWHYDSWSLEETYDVLQKYYAQTPSLDQMVVLDEDDSHNTVAFAHLRWSESPLVTPSTTFDTITGAASPVEIAVEKFMLREMLYNHWNERMTLQGTVFGEWPSHSWVAMSEIAQDSRILLLGVEEFRYVRHQSEESQLITLDSDWLQACRARLPQGNPNLKHYRFGALEVLAISHFVEVTQSPNSEKPGVMLRIPRT